MSLTLLEWLRAAFAALAVLALPGLALLAWFPRRSTAQAAADAVALSIALTALYGQLTFWTGLGLTGLGLALIYLLLAALAVGGVIFRRWLVNLREPWRAWPGTPRPFDWTLVLVPALLLALTAWRLFQARDLLLPAWVDPLHHTLIVRVILEQGSIPLNLLPYMPVELYYHFGFHAVTAAFSALSGLAPERAILVFGQVLNALVALSVYRLGAAVWKDWKRALAAALLVGFFTHMPAYYVTWGRYTLLTGLILLPAAMAQALEIVHGDSLYGRRWNALFLALLTGGILLTHYFAGLLLALFLVVLGLQKLTGEWRAEKRVLWRGWLPLAGAALAGLLLALPWIIRVFSFRGYALDVSTVLPEKLSDFDEFGRYLWYLAGPARNHWLLALGAVGLALALAHPRSRALAVWGALVAILGLPFGVRIAPFRPDHMVIVLFLPLSLLSAHALVRAAEAAEALAASKLHHPRLGWLAGGLALALLLAWGISGTRSLVNTSTLLVTPDDTAALAWIGENTSPEARFFINPVLWQGPTYRPVDGGGWILPLTGRQSLLPPVAYEWGPEAYASEINGWAKRAVAITACDDALFQLLDDARLDYLYAREGAGALQPAVLDGCAGLEPVFTQGAVHVYQVER